MILTICLHTDWRRAWFIRKVLPHSNFIVQCWWIFGCNDRWNFRRQNTILVHHIGFSAVSQCSISDICHSYGWLDSNCSTTAVRNVCWTTKRRIIDIYWHKLPTLCGGSWTKRKDRGKRKDNSGQRHTLCLLQCFSQQWNCVWIRFDHVHAFDMFVLAFLVCFRERGRVVQNTTILRL